MQGVRISVADKNTKRRLRADGERNRQRLLKVAREAFAESGISASLENIARTAGVGIGTLYRHFPTRQMLVDEIYREQGEQLKTAASELSQIHPPLEALQEWLYLFIQSLDNKQIMAGVLASTRDESNDGYCSLSGELLVTVLDSLLQNAVQNGSITRDIESLELLCAIAGIASYNPEPNWKLSAKRLVRVILSGLRHSV